MRSIVAAEDRTDGTAPLPRVCRERQGRSKLAAPFAETLGIAPYVTLHDKYILTNDKPALL